MTRAPRPLPPMVGLMMLLAGCAGGDRSYPSLAPRSVEKLGFAEPETKPVALSPDPALDARIADDRRALDRIAGGFDAAVDHAGVAARTARGRAVGSDAWLDAQVQLARLDDWRAQASTLVTDIDAMIAGRAATLAPVYAPLATLRDDAVAAAAKQGATIDRLQAMLPSG